VTDRIGVTVEAYDYSAAAIDAPASWWRPAEILDEPAEQDTLPSELAAETEEDPRGAFDSEEAQAALRQHFDAGRKAGFEEGRMMEREAMQRAERGRLKEQLACLASKFDEETSRYLNEVEREVVELALAIARRVLRREVETDPLLLTGVVRVALGQLAKTANVRLKAPPCDVALWMEAIAHIPNLAVRPTVVASEQVSAGDCELETELGSVNLGLQSQLEEIERRFFDRSGQTAENPPASKSKSLLIDAKAVS
jgi:flagellar assembly protein FliH